MNAPATTERVADQITGSLRRGEPHVGYFASGTRLGTPGLGLTRGESIELVLTLEKRFDVHLPDEQTDCLETRTIRDLTTIFTALLEDRSSADSPQLPTRDDILLLIAEVQGLAPDEVSEEIDSFTRMWLLHSMEQRYHLLMDIPSGHLAELDSVDHAVQVFRRLLQQTGSNKSPVKEPNS